MICVLTLASQNRTEVSERYMVFTSSPLGKLGELRYVFVYFGPICLVLLALCCRSHHLLFTLLVFSVHLLVRYRHFRIVKSSNLQKRSSSRAAQRVTGI